jgi:hypothetical protein
VFDKSAYSIRNMSLNPSIVQTDRRSNMLTVDENIKLKDSVQMCTVARYLVLVNSKVISLLHHREILICI